MTEFSIQADRWFAWQMMPGYEGGRCVPYCSPIYVTSFKPLKTGKGLLKLEFLNALYATGVQDFSINFKVLKRAKDYMVGELIDTPGEVPERIALISHIEFAWVERFCPELFQFKHPDSTSSGTSSINEYLKCVFFGDQR